MIDFRTAKILGHRRNIQRYARLLAGELTELERQYLHKRIAEEHAEMERLQESQPQQAGVPIAAEDMGKGRWPPSPPRSGVVGAFTGGRANYLLNLPEDRALLPRWQDVRQAVPRAGRRRSIVWKGNRTNADWARQILQRRSRIWLHRARWRGSDVFVHVHEVEAAGMKTLIAGQLLTYNTAPARDGRTKAVNLRLLNPGR